MNDSIGISPEFQTRRRASEKALKAGRGVSWQPECKSASLKVNVRRLCRLALLRPSVWYKKSEMRDQSALRLRIREIAMDCARGGYLRVLVMLKREAGR